MRVSSLLTCVENQDLFVAWHRLVDSISNVKLADKVVSRYMPHSNKQYPRGWRKQLQRLFAILDSSVTVIFA